MALILSTIDDGQITSSQARAFHQSATQSRDLIFPGYGNEFATQTPVYTTKNVGGVNTPIFQAQVGTGAFVCDGVIGENTGIHTVDMPIPSSNGVGALVAVVNLSNKTLTFKMQNHANGFIRQNLVAMQTGIREIPLYFFSFTTTAITAWNDWRPLGNNSGTPAGTIAQFAGDIAPAGWLLCDGSRQFQVRFKELYDAIGTKYGGGGGMFNLPDLRGKTVIGMNASDADFNVLGKTGGSKNHALTVSELPSHNHELNGHVFNWGPNSGNVSVPAANATSGATASGNPLYTNMNVNGWADTLVSGGGKPHSNLQPYIIMNYIIKY